MNIVKMKTKCFSVCYNCKPLSVNRGNNSVCDPAQKLQKHHPIYASMLLFDMEKIAGGAILF